MRKLKKFYLKNEKLLSLTLAMIGVFTVGWGSVLEIKSLSIEGFIFGGIFLWIFSPHKVEDLSNKTSTEESK